MLQEDGVVKIGVAHVALLRDQLDPLGLAVRPLVDRIDRVDPRRRNVGVIGVVGEGRRSRFTASLPSRTTGP